MPDSKITLLASIGTGADPANDPLVIVDVSDTSMAASGTTKKVTLNNLLASGPAATLSSATVTGAVTVGTTLGVTGAATFNGAVTLGDAVGDAVTATGSFTSHTGQNPSAIRAAASDYAAVAFDGATASTRISSTLTGQNIGTGDFSLWFRFRVPTVQPSVGGQGVGILSPSSTGGGNRAFGVRLATTTLNITSRDGTGVTNRNAGITNFWTNFAGQVVDLVLTRSGATLKVYINGTDTSYSDTGSGSWSDTVTSTFLNVGVFDASDIFTGRIYRSVVFNRALSATDVTELITVGVNPADQWGTQTAAYTSDFSVNADSWSQNIGNALLTATGNIDGISGVNDTLRFSNTDTVSVGFQVRRTTTLVTTKRYRVSFDYFAETGSGLQFFGFGFFGTRYDAGSSAVVENAWQTGVSLEAVIPQTQLPISSFTTSTGTVVSSFVAAKNVYFKNIVATRIGAIVDLDFTVGTGYQAPDRSTNNLHGTLFAGVEFTQPRRMAVLYATTAASGNTQLLGSLAIPTNAVIEDVIVNSTGSSTVSVGNVSAGTQIVNAASVVSGRQKLTIATPFSTTGNLWVNSSAAVTLQFTILYTIAA